MAIKKKHITIGSIIAGAGAATTAVIVPIVQAFNQDEDKINELQLENKIMIDFLKHQNLDIKAELSNLYKLIFSIRGSH